MTETILTNAQIIGEAEVTTGTVVIRDGVFADISVQPLLRAQLIATVTLSGRDWWSCIRTI